MDETTPNPAPTDPRLDERWKSLVDILYLGSVTWLYLFSAIYPVVGLFFGILLLSGSVSPGGRKVGKVCLILGIINAVLVIFLFTLILALGVAGTLSALGRE